ncbi:hypothetical protein [Saccharomonospora sp. CUA-673]|uniref:hypothetical protein n=1 Tax=Saccharomonospora sp. CUA-673 TaxID=1904969 RepID=UPI0009F87616|nr:hypothetical protein [Saccharomonospora sp. CUA-673]
MALGAEILLSTGRVHADAPIRVSIPVATRGENDLRSNTTTGVSIAVEADADGRVSDLREVRRRSKEAFGRIGTAPSPAKALEPLAQLLPDPVVARMARSSPVPLCLCSNLGTVPDDYAAPLGVPASSVVLRSVTRGVTRAMLRARGGGVSLWLTRTGDTVALAVLGLDPDHFPGDDTLRTHVRKVLDARGITTTMW